MTPRCRADAPVWPWLIGIGIALALAAGGYFLYQKIQDQITHSKPVRVQQYTGIKVANAKALVTNDGFEPQVVCEQNADVPVGTVFKQDPVEGTSLGRGSPVTLTVSTGKPKVPVPGVVGKSLADAVAALASVKLEANPQNVPSDQPAGTVVAQDPKAGTVLVERSRVRINVSRRVPSRSSCRASSASPTTLQPRSFRPPGSRCGASTSSPTRRPAPSSNSRRPETRCSLRTPA